MSQENLQTMIMQNVWGVKEVYYGIVQVVNNSSCDNGRHDYSTMMTMIVIIYDNDDDFN